MTDSAPASIPYGKLMHQAMRGLIQQVLADVAANGLPGDHHFFITFDTEAEGVAMADWLHDRYPEEMTIVVQHWFDGLQVDDDGFAITLNFGDSPEALRIPYDAILTFVDPSVEFGLRFETTQAAEDPDDDPTGDEIEIEETPEDSPPQGDAQVVQLDTFRKGH